MNKIETDILIIGGGAAGMSAALASAENSGLRVLVVDDNPELGGQIWRSEMGKVKSLEAKRLIEMIKRSEIKILDSAQVFAQSGETCLLAETARETKELHFEKLILATGARERFLPFPNWTLPNVYGAGGLQALVKSGLSVEDKRIVVAGTGPLLLAVADYLRSKGAIISLIVEQASRKKILRFGLSLWRTPKKLFQAVSLKSKMRGTEYLQDAFVTKAEGDEKLESVSIAQNGTTRSIECDFLACGFHLVPNIELPSLLGCELKGGFVEVDDFQKTSAANIYCVGEPTGIGGVELSLVEGEIAGLSAVGKTGRAKSLFSKRQKLRRFAEVLNKTFSLRRELKTLPDNKTIICRCEDVEYGQLKDCSSFREAKLHMRCGMGACQGRVCGSATEFLFGWENVSVRPPIFPVRLESLAKIGDHDSEPDRHKTGWK